MLLVCLHAGDQQRDAGTAKLMMGFFKRGGGHGSGLNRIERTRHSRGWVEVLQFLKSNEGLRVLDFGATSPSNINYLTALGHSVYMADIVGESSKAEWLLPPDPSASKNATPKFDAERFAQANLDFSGRDFDVVLLWDTASYLPTEMVPVLFDRLRTVLRPEGRLLAFFHGKLEGAETGFSRYQLVDGEELAVLISGSYPVRQVFQTRQIEKLLEGYRSVRFFLGKDNVREVVASR